MTLLFSATRILADRPLLSAVSGTALISLISGCASLPIPHVNGPASPKISPAGVTAYAAGDIADCRKIAVAQSGAARTATMIETALATDPTAIVLALGDLVYPAGTTAQFDDCYTPTWGRFKAKTLPAPGNHEYYTSSAQGYFDYFGTIAGPERRGYYSTNLGPWHIISLDSNLKGAASNAQLGWLTADLAALRGENGQSDPGERRCILAFWHHPLYSSGGHGNNPHMRLVWQALLDARADLVLSAHDHNYERFAPQDTAGNPDRHNGIRSFVVGSGGASLTPLGPTKPNSEAQTNAVHGVLRLQLKPGSYDWAFLPADSGAPQDSGSGVCHADAS